MKSFSPHLAYEPKIAYDIEGLFRHASTDFVTNPQLLVPANCKVDLVICDTYCETMYVINIKQDLFQYTVSRKCITEKESKLVGEMHKQGKRKNGKSGYIEEKMKKAAEEALEEMASKGYSTGFQSNKEGWRLLEVALVWNQAASASGVRKVKMMVVDATKVKEGGQRKLLHG